jgi:hypothetical protein
MRKLIFMSLMAICVGTSVVKAQQVSSVVFQPLEQPGLALLSVKAQQPFAGKPVVAIRNTETGVLVYQYKTAQVPVLLEKLNFSKLEPGSYTLSFLGGETSSLHDFQIDQDGNVLVNKPAAFVNTLPHIVQDNQLVRVTFQTLKEMPLELFIADENGTLLHQESMYGKVFSKQYDFKKLTGKACVVTFNVGGKTYQQKLSF